MAFDDEFDEGVDLALTRSKLATRKVALEVFRGVIMMTPVDTGRARANWQASIGSPERGPIDETDKGGGTTVSKAVDVVKQWDFEHGPTCLTNNLPYIERLEDGWSGQAPAGMVAVTIARFDGLAAQVANRVKGGEA